MSRVPASIRLSTPDVALGPSPEIVITSPTAMDLPPVWTPYYTQFDEI